MKEPAIIVLGKRQLPLDQSHQGRRATGGFARKVGGTAVRPYGRFIPKGASQMHNHSLVKEEAMRTVGWVELGETQSAEGFNLRLPSWPRDATAAT